MQPGCEWEFLKEGGLQRCIRHAHLFERCGASEEGCEMRLGECVMDRLNDFFGAGVCGDPIMNDTGVQWDDSGRSCEVNRKNAYCVHFISTSIDNHGFHVDVFFSG